MWTFLKYFALIFLLNAVFLVAYVALHPPGDIATDSIVFFYYLWPLFILPLSGGGHGGELLFAPITILINSAIMAKTIQYFHSRRSA